MPSTHPSSNALSGSAFHSSSRFISSAVRGAGAGLPLLLLLLLLMVGSNETVMRGRVRTVSAVSAVISVRRELECNWPRGDVSESAR